MKEKDWLSCAVSERLLNHVKKSATQRQLRLYGVAVCLLWPLLDDPRSRAAVEAVEVFAQGRLGPADLETARKEVWELTRWIDEHSGLGSYQLYACRGIAFLAQAPKPAGCWGGVRACARDAVEAVAHGPTWVAAPIEDRLLTCDSLRTAEKKAQADLMRDIFGNPFQAISFEATWRTPAVQALARAAEENRPLPAGHFDTDRLAALTDALEQAGCNSEEILTHCRAPGTHVAGCWIIDLILDRL